MKKYEKEYIYKVYLDQWGDRLMIKLRMFYMTIMFSPLRMIRFLPVMDPVLMPALFENRMHALSLQEIAYFKVKIREYVQKNVVNIHNIHDYQSDYVSMVHQLYDARDRTYFKTYWLPLETVEYTHFIDLSEPGIKIFKPMYIREDGGYWTESDTYGLCTPGQ